MALPATYNFPDVYVSPGDSYLSSDFTEDGVANFIVVASSAAVSTNRADHMVAARWDTDTFPFNQYSQAVIADATFSYGRDMSVAVRMQPGTGGSVGTGYAFGTDGENLWMYRMDGIDTWADGTLQSLAFTVYADDIIRIEAVGSDIIGYVNGSPKLSMLGDATYSTGSAGISGYSVGTVKFKTWSAGGISASLSLSSAALQAETATVSGAAIASPYTYELDFDATVNITVNTGFTLDFSEALPLTGALQASTATLSSLVTVYTPITLEGAGSLTASTATLSGVLLNPHTLTSSGSLQASTATLASSLFILNTNDNSIDAISSDIQSLNPGAIIEMFEIDLTALGDSLYRFHSGTNEFNNNIVWNGNTYVAFPIDADGFELSSKGSLPRPSLKISNITGIIGVLIRSLNDLVGAKVTRKRTLLKYLDAANFVAGNPLADPSQAFPDDVFYVNRKVAENRVFVEFELVSVLDLHGIKLPRRQIIQNICTWVYRSSECSYAGGAVATATDATTVDGIPVTLAQDVCGKRLTSCKLRFGQNAQLPYGGFPAAGKL